MIESKFKHDLLNSSYWQQLFNNENVITVFICGSRGIQCNTSSSDYDIGVVVKDIGKAGELLTHYLTYKGKTCHWWVHEFKSIGIELSRHSSLLSFYIQYGMIPKEHILWENPYYKKEIKFLKQNRKRLQNIAIQQWLLWQQQNMDTLLNRPQLTANWMNKRLYQYCYIFDCLFQKDRSADVPFLARIKKAQVSWISETDIEEIRRRVFSLNTYIKDINLEHLRRCIESVTTEVTQVELGRKSNE